MKPSLVLKWVTIADISVSDELPSPIMTDYAVCKIEEQAASVQSWHKSILPSHPLPIDQLPPSSNSPQESKLGPSMTPNFSKLKGVRPPPALKCATSIDILVTSEMPSPTATDFAVCKIEEQAASVQSWDKSILPRSGH